MVGVYSAFMFATLEELYVGTLHLPVCNAVTDGSAIILTLSTITIFIGNNWWATPS
jgi:hypothetical protein